LASSHKSFSTAQGFLTSFWFALLIAGAILSNIAVAQMENALQPQVEKNYQPRPYQGQLEKDDG